VQKEADKYMEFKEALKLVTEEIINMGEDEFKAMLKLHKDGDVAVALLDVWNGNCCQKRTS
jgi:hypothetical protein